jgi:hypothetical protein
MQDLFMEFADDIIKFSQDIEVCYFNCINIPTFMSRKLLIPKLRNYTNYHDGKSVVDGIVDSLAFALSNLIMKAGHIVDTVGECDSSVNYGDAHISRVHRQAGGLLKTTAFQVRITHYNYHAALNTYRSSVERSKRYWRSSPCHDHNLPRFARYVLHH